MPPEQLRELLRRQPFVPFRLFISSGDHLDVPSPEGMMVTSRMTAVGIPGQSGDGDIVATIDNLHITHTLPLVAASGGRPPTS
jgi:hypothetical protein